MDQKRSLDEAMSIATNNFNHSSSPGDSDGACIDAQNSVSRMLPLNFLLSDNDVLCGRGSQCFNHEGNQKFRRLVQMNLQRYSMAPTKYDKTNIIREIILHVRACSPSGGFVKLDLDSGRYFEIGDFHAREKTSQAFRDALQEKYKSSYVSRKKRRSRSDDEDCDRVSTALQSTVQHFDNQSQLEVLSHPANQLVEREYFHTPTIPILTSIQSIQMTDTAKEKEYYRQPGIVEEMKDDTSQGVRYSTGTDKYQSITFLSRISNQKANDVAFTTTPQVCQSKILETEIPRLTRAVEPNASRDHEHTASTIPSAFRKVNLESLVLGKAPTSVPTSDMNAKHDNVEWIDDQSRLLDPMFVTGIVPSDYQYAPFIGDPNSSEYNMYRVGNNNMLLSEIDPENVLSETYEQMFLLPVRTTDAGSSSIADVDNAKTENDSSHSAVSPTMLKCNRTKEKILSGHGRSRSEDHIPTASELTDFFVGD